MKIDADKLLIGVCSFRFGPYFIEPVIAGLDPVTLEPYVSALDLIGCPMVAKDFAVTGTCGEQMYGMCESLWVPDMVGICAISATTFCMLDLMSSYFVTAE
jgi:20S proteasome alpha/beta subunit